jgi:hypothetical protein
VNLNVYQHKISKAEHQGKKNWEGENHKLVSYGSMVSYSCNGSHEEEKRDDRRYLKK